MLKLIWRESAIADAERIVEYIGEFNLDAALRLRRSLYDCAERLAAHPFMYRRGRAKETREAVVHPNYVLIYRVTADTVEILKVVHTRQQYP